MQGLYLFRVQRHQEILRHLQETRQRCLQAGRFQPAAPVDPNLLDLQASYLQRLKRECGEKQEQIRQVESVVGEKRKDLMEATKERRVFEILREQREEAYKRDQKRQERRLLDDVGTQLYLRRRTERE